MYRNLLFPLDGSELAEVAFSYATGLAARLDMSIHLLHVCRPTENEAITERREYVNRVADLVRNRIRDVQRQTGVKPEGGLNKIQSEVLIGYAAEEILHYAEQADIDVICMATHGRSGIKRWALGSVAAKVLRKSTIPVFLVPANIPGDTSYRNWSLGTILVPLDGSPLAEGILPHIEVLAKHGGNEPIEVILVQVCEPPFITADYPEASMPLTWEQHVEHIESTFKRKAEEYLQEVETRLKTKDIKVRSEVLMGKPADQIIEYAQKNGIGLTAMSTHGYSGVTRWAYGSVADKVLHRIHTPIFLVRPR